MNKCPCCEEENLQLYLTRNDVPCFLNIKYKDKEQALSATCGNLKLKICHKCGMVHNDDFNNEMVQYNQEYENSQNYSLTFQKYLKEIVDIISVDYGVKQGKIVEVGCGDGYFLSLLANKTQSIGIGFDKAHVHQPDEDINDNIKIYNEYYDVNNAEDNVDLLVCRHVIEHVQDPYNFLLRIRETLIKSKNALVYFETPRLEWIVENNAFYDFFYEHCNYFTESSLSILFDRAGFDILELKSVFKGQYQCVFARLKNEDLNVHKEYKNNFMLSLPPSYFNLSEKMRKYHNVAIWGAGAKGVALANMIDVKCVIDINPKKQGCFVPKCGVEILSPKECLRKHNIDCILVMNPNYYDEVKSIVDKCNNKIEILNVV